jgi:hypothetical protein
LDCMGLLTLVYLPLLRAAQWKQREGTACWLDDGRLQAITDDTLSDASSIGPPPYNEAVAERGEDEAGGRVGNFRGAWRSAAGGPSNAALGPEYHRAQVARSAVPIAGCVYHTPVDVRRHLCQCRLKVDRSGRGRGLPKCICILSL